jgi:hypothetical protein
MKLIALATAIAMGGSGLLQDEPTVPKELQSPIVKPGSAAEYLRTLERNKLHSEQAEGRHAALILLETLPDTRNYLGSALAKLLRADMKRTLTEDLKASAWADCSCPMGETAVIAAGINRAGRFKELALPVLWEIAEENRKSDDPVLRRSGLHALRAIFAIHRAAKEREALRAKLSELGEKALVAKLEEWGK